MTLYDIFGALIQSVIFWSIGHDVSEPDKHTFMQRKVASTSTKSSKLVSKVQMENDKGRDREGHVGESSQQSGWTMRCSNGFLFCSVLLN
jgi:hypothetical protein